MVQLLGGEIQPSSIPNEITTFEAVLPQLPVQDDDQPMEPVEALVNARPELVKAASVPELKVQYFSADRQTIMIVDDDPSMLWFIAELFAGQYNVIPVSEPQKVMEQLKLNLPDLIISDVMMPHIDGISLIKMIKSDKLMSHIPLILLSARHDVEEQVSGIESGAEIYLTKPFNVTHLEKIVARLLQREEEMKDYYGSVYSAFELDDGQFLHKDDKEFFEKMMQVINANIANHDLSVETLSASLGYGARHFYRKLKRITDKTPADIIKEYRLSAVERLLVTSNLSIDEICYKAGLMNRGNFYRIFTRKYGTTPKKYRLMKQQEFREATGKE
jgi:DNA-binding response OmpR family regulator